MFRLFALVLTSFFVLQAQALAPISGVVCTQDQLPDGDLQEYELRMNGSKYEVVYRLQKGSMMDGVEENASEVVIAKGLDCSFGPKTNGLSACQLKDTRGNVVGYFNTKLNVETYVSTTTHKEYETEYFLISMHSPELAAHFEDDRYPQEANKTGTLYIEFNGRSCRYK